MNTIFTERAKAFAIKTHGNQTYGEKPYEYHLQKVVDNVIKYSKGKEGVWIENAIQIAWLHDTLEDTNLTYQELQDYLGYLVAIDVWRVTDEPGENRKERKLKTWHKIRQSERATFIKLCDRLANVSEGGKLDMYKKEHPVFQAALYVPGQFEELWAELNERLA